MRTRSVMILPLILLIVTACNLASRHPAPPEFQALLWVKKLQQAESQYYGIFHRYGSLEDLGPSGAGLIESEFVDGSHAGFQFTIELGKDSYVLRATPAEFGKRSFYTDQTRVVRVSSGEETATANSEPVK